MIRLLLFALTLGIIAVGASWIGRNPGELSLTWQGWQVDTSVAFLLMIVVVLAVLGWLLFVMLAFILGGPDRWKRTRKIRHYQKGIDAMTGSLVALASGQKQETHKQLRLTERYLGHTPATLLIGAQLAKAENKEDDARELLEKMLEYKETRLLAAKGLSEYHDRHAHIALALPHAETAIKLNPRDDEALRRLVSLRGRLGQWQEAEMALKKYGRALTRDEKKHLSCLLYLVQSEAARAKADKQSALSFAATAWKLQPDFPPAAITYIRRSIEANELSQVRSTLLKSWKLAPHPRLTQLAIKMMEEGTTEKGYTFAKRLAAQNPDQKESHLLVGEMALKMREWETAHREIKLAMKHGEGERACLLMARLEKAQGNSADSVALWNERAAAAGTSKWKCDECHERLNEWRAYCSECGAFDSLSWNTPSLVYKKAG